MAFVIQYQSEPKNVVLNHLRQNPSHEWDDFRRTCRGARHVQRHIFKEVKSDMQLKGLIPLIPGDKAYNIVRREVEQELKAKLEEEAEAAASFTPPVPEPDPAAPPPPLMTTAPTQELAKDADWNSIPDEPAGAIKSAVTGMWLRNTEGISAKMRYDIEIMVKEMPDLSVNELLEAFKLPPERELAVRVIRTRIRSVINYKQGSSMPKENAALYEKCRADMATLSKSDVSTINLASYRERFKRPAMTSQVFNNVKSSVLKAWANGQGPAARRSAAATASDSLGKGLTPAPNIAEHPTPVLAPGVVICRIDDAKVADGERNTLRNVMPTAIQQALKQFGITAPPLKMVVVEDEDEKYLEIRVK